MSALTLLISGSKVDKLFFLFQVYDMDGMYWYIQWTTYEYLYKDKHVYT